MLLGSFVFATLATGAVHVWAYTIVFGVTFFLTATVLLVSGISILRTSTKPPSSRQTDRFAIDSRNPLFWLLLALILLIVFQLVPLPYPVLETLSPFTANLYRQAHEITAMDGGHSICSLPGCLSLDRDLTVKSLLTFCAYLAFAFLVTWSVQGARDLRRIAVILITFSATLALYGCLMFLDESTGIFSSKRRLPLYGGRIASTLINPDHFASYLIMGIFLAFGYFCSVLKSLPVVLGRTRRRRFLNVLNSEDSPLPKALLLFFLMAIMILTLVYTLSRGGVAALFISMVFCLLLLFLRTLKPLYLLLALPLAAVLGYYIEMMGVDLLLQRLADTQRELAAIDTYQRMILFRRGLELWQTFPLFGVGLGAFPIIFPMVQPADLGIYDIPYIHSDWLQLAIETGWVGALLILFIFAFLFIQYLIRWWKTEDPWGFGFGLAALGTMVAISIHELVDFSLRIPCNPLFLVIVIALAGVGLGASNRSRSTASAGGRHSLAAGSGCIFAAAAIMFLSFQTAKFGLAERYCPTEKSSVNVVQSELRSSMVRKALTLNPLNSEYYQLLVVAELLDQPDGRSGDEEERWSRRMDGRRGRRCVFLPRGLKPGRDGESIFGRVLKPGRELTRNY